MRIRDKLDLCRRILLQQRCELVSYAERELPPANGDTMNQRMNRDIMELVFVFSTQGHSGFSANYARSALAKLLAFEPLRPLTGEPSEWQEVGPGVYQNKRCSRVFKQADRFDGRPYDLDGRVFREPSGLCFTNNESMVPIEFPYTPTIEYVDVPTPAEAQS